MILRLKRSDFLHNPQIKRSKSRERVIVHQSGSVGLIANQDVDLVTQPETSETLSCFMYIPGH